MSLPSRDQALCRICFEGGAGLIAPCHCKGSSRWVHRRCLDEWRGSGVNPRALSNCTTCGFQYRLTLQRPPLSELQERQKWFFIRLATQGLGAFILLQVSIVSFALAIRHVDQNEALVRFFDLPQHKGHELPGTFLEALLHHKTTYYLAGMLAFFTTFGLVTLTQYCLCRYHSQVYESFGYCGAHSASYVCLARMVGSRPEAFLITSLNCLSIVAIMLIVMVVSGLLTFLACAVIFAQSAGKEWAKIRQMQTLASEYVVQDLSDVDVGQMSLTNSGSLSDLTEDEIHGHLEEDMAVLFGAPSALQPVRMTHPNFGSAGYGAV